MIVPTGPQWSCHIELSKTDGITIVIKDRLLKDAHVRKIELGASSITVTCKNGPLSSVVTQSDGSINTQVTTAQDGQWTTGGKCTIQSAQDTLIESAAKLTARSAQALAVSSLDAVTVSATTKLGLSGAQAEVSGTSTLTASSQGSAELSGMTVAVKGQTQLTAEAPITSVGQSMTTLKGQIVEISGALIKLG
jgi:hypothetical protein